MVALRTLVEVNHELARRVREPAYLILKHALVSGTIVVVVVA